MPGDQSEHPSAALQSMDAPSREETVADPKKTLDWISARLAQIYSVPTPVPANFNRDTYANLYTAMSNLCSTTKDARRSQKVTAVTGQDLYSSMEKAIRGYCRQFFDDLPEEKVLVAYNEHWTTFLRLSGLTKHLFQPLEDRWIRREIDESNGQVYHVPQLHTAAWRDEVLARSTTIEDAIVATEQRDQENEALRETYASLSSVGLVLSGGRLVASD